MKLPDIEKNDGNEFSHIQNQPLKVVLDTNVIISAALCPYGNPAKIFEMILLEEIKNYTSEDMLEELHDVIHRSEITQRLGWDQREFMLHHIDIFSVKVKPNEKIDLIKDDPDDNKIIECALTGKVNFIISGDDHLLKLEQYKEIKILTPAKFIELTSKKK